MGPTANFSFADELAHGVGHVFHRYSRIDAVQVVQLDMVRAQASE